MPLKLLAFTAAFIPSFLFFTHISQPLVPAQTFGATVSTFDSWITTNSAATSTARGNLQVNKNLWVNGTSTLATTTTSVLNGVIVVDGVRYAKTGAGIQSALTANALRGGGEVYIPKGVYIFNSGDSLSFFGAPTKLTCAGASTTILQANTVTGGIIYDYFGEDTDPNLRPNIEISGCTFDVNYKSNVSAIQFGSNNNLAIHHNTILHVKDVWGVAIGSIGGQLGSETPSDYATTSSRGARFEFNEVASSTFGTHEGVLCVNCRDYSISHNYFHNLTQGAAAFAVYMGSTNGVITNNIVASSSIKSFYSSGADHYTLSNNTFYNAENVFPGSHIQIFNTTFANVHDNIMVGENNGSSGSGGILIYDYATKIDGHNTTQWATTSNISIDGNIFHSGYYGVVITDIAAGSNKHYEKHDIAISNNQFIDTLWKPVDISVTGAEPTLKLYNIFIHDNKMASTSKLFSGGSYNISGSSTNPQLIRNIYLYNNSATTSTAGGNSAGIYIDGADTVKVYENNVTGTGRGSWDDIEITGNVTNYQTENLSSSGLDISAGCFSVGLVCVTNPFTVSGNLISTSSARFGIGTSSPDSAVSFNQYTGRALLHIGDNTTNNSMTRLLVENRWNAAGGYGLIISGGNSNAYEFTVDGNGNVGIGATTTAGSILSINNLANFTTSTSTFYSSGGINLKSGCFAINGSCLSSTPNQWYIDGTSFAQTNSGLQSALNTCSSAGGGTVYLPNAFISLTSPITLKSNCNLVGLGSSTVIVADTANVNVFVGSNIANVTIKDFKIDGNEPNQSATLYGIYLDSVSSTTIDNMTINRVRNRGVLVTNSQTITLKNSSFAYGKSQSIDFASTTNSVIDNNTFYGEFVGIWLDGATDYLRISNNKMYDLLSYGIITGDNSKTRSNYISVINNSIYNSAEDAIGIVNTDYATLDGNYIYNNGSGATDEAIDINNSRYTTIVGNRVKNSASYPIQIQSTSNYCTITGNILVNAGTSTRYSVGRAGILLSGSYCSVSGNQIFDEQPSSTMRWAIRINTGADYNTVAGNSTYGSWQDNISFASGIGVNNAVFANGSSTTSFLPYGNIGFGTTTPGSILSIAGLSLGTANLLTISTSTASATNTAFLISKVGLVGIGTTSPAATFQLSVHGGTYLAGNTSIQGNLGVATTSAPYQIYAQGSASGAVTSSLGIDNTAGGNSWGTKLSFLQAGAERGKIQTYFPNSAQGYSLLLGAGNSLSAMHINSAGLVGIATTSPWALLSVNPNGLLSGAPEFVVGSSSKTDFIITNNGNIGLGNTTTPGTIVSLNNLANFTLATSTFYSTGGINLTGGGCFAIGGNCIGGSGGSGTVSAGTAGQIPYYAANGTTLTPTSTIFLSTDKKFGVGSSSPSSQLSVLGTTTLGGYLLVGTTAPPYTVPAVSAEFWGDKQAGMDIGMGNISAANTAYAEFFFNNDLSTDKTDTHYAVIGLNSSAYSDTTYGTFNNQNNTFYMTNTDGPVAISAATTTASKSYLIFGTGGNTASTERMRIDGNGLVGIGTTTPWGLLALNADGGTNPYFTIGSSTATLLTVTSGAKIGIGTTSPWAALTLDRNAATASSTIAIAEYRPATSTAATIDCRTSIQHHWRMGASATTLTLAGMIPGQTCRVIVENPNSTAGAITWAAPSGWYLQWIGGTTPTQTTTANHSDVWSFVATQGSSTPVIIGIQSANAF